MVSVKKILLFQWIILFIIILGVGFIGIQVYGINAKINSESNFIESINKISRSTYIILSTPISELAGSKTADIYVDENGVAWSKGTAFAVTKDGWLLTAYHILDKSKGVNILEFDQEGKEILTQVESVFSDPAHDFSLIKINKELVPVKLIKDYSQIKSGTEIGFMGYPKDKTALFTHDGIISRVYEDKGLIRYNIHAFVNQGQSGGPIFLPNTGEVIGFISARIKASDLPKRELMDTSIVDNELLKVLLELKRGQDEIYNILSEELGQSSQMGIGIVVGINKGIIDNAISKFNKKQS